MPKLTESEVQHVAKLARLKLSPGQAQLFAEQLGSILEYVEKLNELDTTDVEPTAHAAPITNVLREDRARPAPGVEVILENAPERDGSFFKVPKVLEQDDA